MKVYSPYFDKKMTDIIKGVALLCMFAHHFWTFPEWWTGKGLPMLEEIGPYLREPLKVCVPIFCFITGYTYFFHKNKTYKYSIRKITDVLVSYWGVFLFLVLLEFCFTDYKYSVRVFIKEMLAIEQPTIVFGWYVSFYCIFMLLFPLISKLFLRSWILDVFLWLIFLPLFFRILQFIMPIQIGAQLLSDLYIWGPCVIGGYISAAYNLFEMIEIYFSNLKKNWNRKLIILFFLVLPIFRNTRFILYLFTLRFNGTYARINMQINLDSVIVLFFMYAVIFTSRKTGFPQRINCILEKIGKKSMLMWLVSCMFFNKCNVVMQKILYYFSDPIVSLILGTVICYVIACGLDFIIKYFIAIKNRIGFICGIYNIFLC